MHGLTAFTSHKCGPDADLDWDIDTAMDSYLDHLDAGGAEGRAAEPSEPAAKRSKSSGDVAPSVSGSMDSPSEKGVSAPQPATSGGDDQERGSAQAILEKNRRAQKRFRARQKARLKGMEERLLELTVSVKGLTAENATLRNRNAALETALQARSFPAPDKLPPPAFASGAFGSLTPVDTQPLRPAHSAHGASLARAMSCEEEPAISGRLGARDPATPEATAQTPYATKKDTGAASAESAPAVLEAGGSAPLLPPGAREGDEAWKDVVRTLAGLLLKADTQRGTPASLQDLTDVASQAGWMLLKTSMVSQASMQQMLQGSTTLQSNTDIFWRNVAVVLDLTPEQRCEVLRLRHGMLAKEAQLLEQRRRLNLQIKMLQLGGELNAADAATLRGHMDALKLNLREAHVAVHDFTSAFFKQVLNPLQFVRAAVQAYPLYPDAPALAAWIAAEAPPQPPAPLPPTSFFEAFALPGAGSLPYAPMDMLCLGPLDFPGLSSATGLGMGGPGVGPGLEEGGFEGPLVGGDGAGALFGQHTFD